MTDQEREARNREDRKWLAKFEDDMRKLKANREQIPLEVLQTRYARAYNTLVAEVECDADWWAKRYMEVLAFPRHPQDTAGNERLDKRIAAILQEEQQPGGRVERYKAALIQDLDRKAYEQLVWEIYERMEREAFLPYWNAHCRWIGEPGKRWLYNDITKMYWCPPDRRPDYWKERDCFKNGVWISQDWTKQNTRWPPEIREEPK